MTITKALYFDLDGTLASLYEVPNWLDYLVASDPFPYEVAKPLLNLSALAKRLNNLQRNGWKIGVISWLAKNSTPEFDEKVTEAKRIWLEKHLASVKFDEIKIVSYGTPKSTQAEISNGILFDDEIPNHEEWEEKGGWAFTPEKITDVLEWARKVA